MGGIQIATYFGQNLLDKNAANLYEKFNRRAQEISPSPYSVRDEGQAEKRTTLKMTMVGKKYIKRGGKRGGVSLHSPIVKVKSVTNRLSQENGRLVV